MKLDLTLLLSKRCMGGFKLFVLLFFSMTSFAFISCTEENSDSLPDGTYIKQDYNVLFSDKNPTLAYALFQKQDGKVFSEVKLTGEQKILANGKEMKYHYLDDNIVFGYSYSMELGNSDEIIFGFRRYKDKMIYNKVSKSDVKPLSLPENLSEVINGKEVKWIGAPLATGEVIESFLDTDKQGYKVYFGDLNGTGDGFIFNNVPAGKYTLNIKRCVTIDTKENDGNANGKITVAFYDKQNVVVK